MNENYKYTILINQFAAIENGLDLDIIDLAIFDYIKDFSGSNYCSKIATPEGTYFWLSHKKIIQDLPLLKIKSAQGIIKRISNLINNGIFEKHPNCELYGKTLYKAGVNYDLLIFGKSVDTPQQKFKGGQTEVDSTPQQKFRVPPNESLGYYNINDNIIIDNNINTKDEFFEKNSPETKISDLSNNQQKEKRKKVAQKNTISNHQIIIDVYFDWFKQRNDGVPPNINAAEAKAAKMIAEYFKTIQAKKEPHTTEEEMPEKIKNMALYIFSKWDTLEVFLQKQVKLTQINSNITNIINFIKNGKQATNNSNKYNKQPVTNDTITERFKYFSEFFDRE